MTTGFETQFSRIIRLYFALCTVNVRHLSRTLYKSTTFYAKRTQFAKCPKNVSAVLTGGYRNESLQRSEKTNPKRTQTNPIKANLKPKRTQYEPNTNPIQSQKRDKFIALCRWRVRV